MCSTSSLNWSLVSIYIPRKKNKVRETKRKTCYRSCLSSRFVFVWWIQWHARLVGKTRCGMRSTLSRYHRRRRQWYKYWTRRTSARTSLWGSWRWSLSDATNRFEFEGCFVRLGDISSTVSCPWFQCISRSLRKETSSDIKESFIPKNMSCPLSPTLRGCYSAWIHPFAWKIPIHTNL